MRPYSQEVLAEITFHKTPRDKLWRAIEDLDRYGDFVPFLKEAKVGLCTLNAAGR